MNLDQALFAVEVLRTPLGRTDWPRGDEAVRAQREGILEDYYRVEKENPHWQPPDVSRWVRAEWLRAYVNGGCSDDA